MEHQDLAKLELRTMRSAWRSLTGRWELSPRECRALLPEGGEDRDDMPRDTETRMRLVIEIGYRVTMPEVLLADWLRTPSATLGWLTPLDVMGGPLADVRGLRRIVDQGFAS